MGSSNAYTPATPAQIRYIIQWFEEWGEMQRTDFLPVLVEKFHSEGNVNGLISNVDACNLEDRPPSIFQCRIKLFKEWSDTWNQADKDQLLCELRSIDQEFIEKFEKLIICNKESLVNGNVKTVTN
ncbi:hypothetical protein PGB90_004835 [Kerria lacca]